MPSNYTGDGAALAPHVAPVIACPVDADPANAASVNTPLQKLADYLAYLQQHAALLDVANLFTAAQTHSANVSGSGAFFVLVQTFQDSSTATKTRVYVDDLGGVVVTRNAFWNHVAGKWLEDVWIPGSLFSASRLSVSNGGMTLETYGHATNDLTNLANGWANAAWVTRNRLANNGLLRFFDTIDGGTGNSNPLATEAQANTLCAKNTPKAWATLHVALGVVTVTDGFNLAYDSSPDAYTIRLKFPTGGAMHDGSYLVLGNVDLAAQFHCMKASRTTAGFDVKFAQFDLSGYMNIPPLNPGFDFDVLVFGRQDS